MSQFTAEIHHELFTETATVTTNCSSIVFISLNPITARKSVVLGYELGYREPFAINFDSNTTITTPIKLTIFTNSDPNLIDKVLVIKSFTKPL